MQMNLGLVFLTLVFVGTSTVTGSQYAQWRKPQVPVASASVMNGSTIDDIMKELNMRLTTYLVDCYVKYYYISQVSDTELWLHCY